MVERRGASARPPLARLPTLTEVIEPGSLPPANDDATPEAPAAAEAELVAAVMRELQPRIDLMFEYRLREALSPLLARLADAVLQDARSELAATLRDVVARAVAHEMARRRGR